ncbi:DUF3857 domain-containing protein [uncultured Algoriphagus sp.]|mgnify:CR=1 FL=1|uniref:DUF3857 domain-containing protein n=1 Tax=uncultured Algoriphagus sp. TaxID=417365 RepID=UPI0030ECD6DF|tara:strand:+ start:59365 stop:61302 length:1938 start_codon:yes stop_codon:yes gene_type:complete
MTGLVSRYLISCLIVFFIPLFTHAQVTFGEYSLEELALESVPFEPEAKQVTLYEEANAYFKVNGIYTDYIFRYKVLDDNSEGFGDFRILFYKGDYLTEDITRLKAQVSYLDGDQRKVVQLSTKTHIKEINVGEGYFEFRIAFPHVKKGSILEYSYTKMDKSYSILDGWAFQAEIPALISKYTFKAPDFFQYQMITQGKILKEVSQISQKKNTYSWTVKNIHSLPEEPFVGNIMDHEVRVDGYLFTSQYVSSENLETSDIFYASWNQMSTRMRESTETASYLGDKIPKANYPSVVFKDSTEKATAVKAFDYVSKNYKAYSSRWLEPFYSLPVFLDKKEGNSFDKNLLLSHLLKLEGIDSHIVMVNERGRGRSVLIEKPYINQFQSSILLVKIDGQQVFLDATDSTAPFGLLPLRKLVPRGFFMEKNNGRLDDIKIPHRSGIIHLVNLEVDSTQRLQFAHTLKYTDYAAIEAASMMENSSYEKSMKELGVESEIFDFSFDNQLKDKRVISMKYNTSISNSSGDILVLNPFELSYFAKNLYTQNDRILPIDFDYPMFENFNVNFTIPEGYVLDDYPENQVITIPSKGVKFSYQIDATGQEFKIYTKLEIVNTTFPAAEYSDLKFIMESVASKLSEPVILKKKSTPLLN